MLEISLPVPGCPHRVSLRVGTTDFAVYREIFIQRTHHVNALDSPQFIIDAGANIGLSSIDFALRYPSAKTIAIEPEGANFEIMRKNTTMFRNIVPIRAALWMEASELSVIDPGLGSWGFRTVVEAHGEREMGTAPTLTVEGIMAEYGVDLIDILKLDVEGSEKEIFEESERWIRKVRVLIVELHDEFREGCSRAFQTIEKYFVCEQRGAGKLVCVVAPLGGEL